MFDVYYNTKKSLPCFDFQSVSEQLLTPQI